MATNTITSPGTSIVSTNSVTINWSLDSGYGNNYGYVYWKSESASSWTRSSYINNPYSNNSYTLDTSSWTNYGKYYVYLVAYGGSGNITTPQILLVKGRTDKATQILKMKYGSELIQVPLYSSSGNSNKLKMNVSGTTLEADTDDNNLTVPTINMQVGDNKKKILTNQISPFYSYGAANYISYYYYYTYYYQLYNYYYVSYVSSWTSGYSLSNYLSGYRYSYYSTTTYTKTVTYSRTSYRYGTASRTGYKYTRRTTYRSSTSYGSSSSAVYGYRYSWGYMPSTYAYTSRSYGTGSYSSSTASAAVYGILTYN